MDVGAVLADDKTFYFTFCRQEKLLFFVKNTVQCSDELNHKTSLKLSK